MRVGFTQSLWRFTALCWLSDALCAWVWLFLGILWYIVALICKWKWTVGKAFFLLHLGIARCIEGTTQTGNCTPWFHIQSNLNPTCCVKLFKNLAVNSADLQKKSQFAMIAPLSYVKLKITRSTNTTQNLVLHVVVCSSCVWIGVYECVHVQVC